MPMISVQNVSNNEGRKRKYKFRNRMESFEDWTTEEKCQLLEALNKYGHLDAKNLSKSVPTKNKEKIRLYINYLWVTANKSSVNYTKKYYSKRRRNVELNKLSAVDEWLNLLKLAQPRRKYNEIKCLPIAKAFYFISKFEMHPDPVHCNGIDFSVLYETLYNMLCGYPIRNIDAPTRQFLLKSFREIQQDINRQDKKKRIQFLNELKFVKYTDSNNRNSLRDLKNAGKCIMALSRMQGYNPLAIPVNLLRL